LNRQGTVKRASAPSVDLPGWLPADAWAMFDRFRKSKDSKAWTDDARELAIRKLGELRASGHDPQLVIEQSVFRGWTGLFPLKGDFLERQRQATATGGVFEQSMSAAQEARAMIFGDSDA